MFVRLRHYFRIKRQSLIFRVLFYFILSMIFIALILGINFSNRVKPHFKQELLPNLARYIEYVIDDIGLPHDLEKAKSLAHDLPFEIRIEGPDIDWSSQAFVRSIDLDDLRQAPFPYRQYFIGRERGEFTLMVEHQAYRYLFVVDRSFREGSRKRHLLLFTALGLTLFVLYLLIRRMFQPISTLSQRVAEIGEGKLDDPLDIIGEGELARLAQGIDQMSAQIKTMLESKAGLLLAISHELRSPMTRMRVNLELLDAGEVRDLLIDDLREMEQLVANILESERLNANHAPLNRLRANFTETVESVIDDYFSGEAITRNLAPIVAEYDDLRIRLLIKNLLDNACRHSAENDSPVEVTLERQDDWLQLQIADHGSGIDAHEIERLTEPFYRTDAARQRKTGGYGLGLYLAKLIVDAHSGELIIQSETGQGTRLKVRLPLSLEGS